MKHFFRWLYNEEKLCCDVVVDDDHDEDIEDKNDDDDDDEDDVMKMMNQNVNHILEVDLSGSNPASFLPWNQLEPF